MAAESPLLGDFLTGWTLCFLGTYNVDDSITQLSTCLLLLTTRVTRNGKVLGLQHRVTAYEGVKAITLWPAYQHVEEKQKGSIEVGKQANFVILSVNPLTVAP